MRERRPRRPPRGEPRDVLGMTDEQAQRICAECGGPYRLTRWDGRYCSTKCKDAFFTKARSRGAPLYRAAMRWRKKRDAGAFTEMTLLLDNWIRDDQDAAAESQKGAA